MTVSNSSLEQPLLICSSDAAKLLSISEKNLWTLTKQGIIPAVRIGVRSIRYSVVVLQDLIAKNALATA